MIQFERSKSRIKTPILFLAEDLLLFRGTGTNFLFFAGSLLCSDGSSSSKAFVREGYKQPG